MGAHTYARAKCGHEKEKKNPFIHPSVLALLQYVVIDFPPSFPTGSGTFICIARAIKETQLTVKTCIKRQSIEFMSTKHENEMQINMHKMKKCR